MKRFSKLILILILTFIAIGTGVAQNASPAVDTLKTKSQNIKSTEDKKDPELKQNGQSQASVGNAYGKIKRIKSTRPDMSRARGARPPSIVRPSGSGIPKGVGKPGGIGRKGGR